MKLFMWFSPKNIPETVNTYKFSERAKIITLWLLVAGIGILLFLSRHLLPVFIWAAIAAYLLNPFVTFFSEKTKVPRAVSILVIYVMLLLLTTWAIKTVFPLFSSEAADFFSGSFDKMSISGRIASQGVLTFGDISIDLKEVITRLSDWTRTIFSSHAFPIFFGAVERAVFFLVFFIVAFYFLLEPDKYRRTFDRIIPDPYREEISSLIERMNLTIGAYIRAQVLLILIMSVASFVVLSVLRIKYTVVASLLTGVLEIIPIAGPIIATAIVAGIALLQNTAPYGLPNGLLAAIVVACYFLLRQFEDYFVIPNIASKFVNVHPIVGIFALLLGGSLGGVLGLFLAIPTAALLKVLFSYFYRKLTEN